MTLPPALVRVASWCRSLPATFLLLAACAASCLLAVRGCNRAGRAEDSLAAAVERAQVEKQNVATAQELERAGLERQLAASIERETKATGKASQLQAEVKRLLGAAPGGHVTDITSGDTGWIPTGPSAGSAQTCLFQQGDEGRVHTDQVRARYKHGTVGVVGTADAFGRAPGGVERLLFGGPLKLDVAVEGAPREPGWSWGAGGGISGTGALAAVLVQTPPVEIPLVHWPARAWFLGAGGATQGLVLAGASVEP